MAAATLCLQLITNPTTDPLFATATEDTVFFGLEDSASLNYQDLPGMASKTIKGILFSFDTGGKLLLEGVNLQDQYL